MKSWCWFEKRMSWAIFRNRKVAGKRLEYPLVPIEEGPHRSIRTSHSLLWIHGHIGVDELVDQVFDSGLEDMDVLVRLDADHVLSHP